MSHNARRCSARRKDGRPCRAWAVRDSEPARCASHQSAEQAEQEEDFNESGYAIKQATDLLCKNAEETLTNELRVTRAVVREILEQLRHELDSDEYARFIELVFKGNTTIADIMRAQQALSGKAKGGLPPEFKEAVEKVKRKHRTEP